MLEAAQRGIAASDRGNGEIALAFQPNLLGEYVSNLISWHTLGATVADLNTVQAVAQGTLAVNDATIEALPTARKKVVQSVARTLRDREFDNRIMRAYQRRCAFSGVQLNLLDAAHIVPVKTAGSTDETANGIALSPLYHRAYDRSLVTFDEKYRIRVNASKLNSLVQDGLGGGKEQFLANLRPTLLLPAAITDRPNVAYIQQANALRGW